MTKTYSVVQINNYIKNMFDTDFVLNNVSVSGEVSNCKYHGSGHIYFTLKDEGGTLSAIMFAGNRMSGLKFKMTDGMKVIVTGNISIYEAAGKYQIYAKQIKEDGNGELYEKYLELKKRLEEMGMFDPIYKKPIPKYIKRLGVVTARTGAAVHDIINVSRRRNPGIEIFLYPAKVQGEGAALSVCQGIEALEKAGVDTIIVGRGGGSIEDLWAFNEEMVARTVFDCDIPIISAVGHETDFTIIDFVSDLRAPTPSAAAELAVCQISEVVRQNNDYIFSIEDMLYRKLDSYRDRLLNYKKRLDLLSPAGALNNKRIMLDDISDKLNLYIKAIMDRNRARFKLLCAKLNASSPISRLESGYSYVEGSDGKSIKSVQNVQTGDALKVYVSDGYFTAEVKDVVEERK